MAELFPLNRYAAINTDLDGTLAHSDSAWGPLAAEIAKGEGYDPQSFVAEVIRQRGVIRRETKAAALAAGSKNGAPYDVYAHLKSSFGLANDQLEEYIDSAAAIAPNLLLPGAREWLQTVGGLAVRRRILSFGHPPTQAAKMRINGVGELVAEHGFEIAIVRERKGSYLSGLSDEGPELLVDDRENNTVGLPDRVTAVLLDPAGGEREGLIVVRDLPQLLDMARIE